MRQSQAWVVIGEIIRPHGVWGDVKVLMHTDYPHRFDSLTEVYVQQKAMEPELRSFSLIGRQKEQVICRIGGVDSREAASMLRGALIVVPRDEAMELPPGEYNVFDLVGLQVHTENGEYLGRIREVLQPGANDVYVIEPEASSQEILLPAIKDVVLNVDLEQGNMLVRLLPGLIE